MSKKCDVDFGDDVVDSEVGVAEAVVELPVEGFVAFGAGENGVWRGEAVGWMVIP